MSTTLLQNTQKIRGFQHQRFEYCKEKLIWVIKRKDFHCPRCGSLKVRSECVRIRDIQGLPMGQHLVYFRIRIHRLYCQTCHRRNFEHLHFLSSANTRITRELERRIIYKRPEMSIRSIAMKYHLRWELVKEIEKRSLERKYARVSAAHVRQIGIDEIHIGRNSDRTFRFLTIVRDLQSGAVIHVGNGKGVTALNGLSKKLRKNKLKVVAMDMSNAYASWVGKHCMLFLRNMEEWYECNLLIIRNMRKHFKELIDAYMLKEALRRIYATVSNVLEARAAFRRWATF